MNAKEIMNKLNVNLNELQNLIRLRKVKPIGCNKIGTMIYEICI